jgi:hypothetical protein
VFDRLLEAGATIIVIDHDLDLLAAADHLIDGPGGGCWRAHNRGRDAEDVRAPGRDRAVAGEHLGVPGPSACTSCHTVSGEAGTAATPVKVILAAQSSP